MPRRISCDKPGKQPPCSHRQPSAGQQGCELGIISQRIGKEDLPLSDLLFNESSHNPPGRPKTNYTSKNCASLRILSKEPSSHSTVASKAGLCALRADTGHARTQAKQSIHFLVSVFSGSSTEIAPTGQTLAQIPQRVHPSDPSGKKAIVFISL